MKPVGRTSQDHPLEIAELDLPRAAGLVGITLCPGKIDPDAATVTVDGITQPALTNLDATLPQEIYGVEIYNGAARLPVQFGGLRTDNWCGLIAIYTRDR